MKKLTFFTLITLAITSAFGQNNSNPWPTTGNVGIGTTAPTSNLQIHGTTDYIYYGPAGPFGGTTPSINYGKTSKIALTNSTAGSTVNDGGILRMSALDFSIYNQELGDLTLGTKNCPGMTFSSSTQKIWVGNFSTGSPINFALFNIRTSDNGLFVQSSALAKYALRLKARENESTFQVEDMNGALSFNIFENGRTELNYKQLTNTDKVLLIRNPDRKLLQLTNDGVLRAREIVVDLALWSDYVFEPTYKLMPLTEVKQYISENKHLPNVPSAAVMEAEGLNVAETSRMLMEKVEELTLYLIQLEEKVAQQNALIQEQAVQLEELLETSEK